MSNSTPMFSPTDSRVRGSSGRVYNPQSGIIQVDPSDAAGLFAQGYSFVDPLLQSLYSQSSAASLVDSLGGLALPAIPTYLGQVATRSFIPNNIATGFKSGNGQTFHVAQDNIDWLQVAYANWYQNNTVHEAGSGGTVTFTASIQYPISSTPATGEWQEFTWEGELGTGALANGETSNLSDRLQLLIPIPRGKAFLLRWHAEASAQIPFYQFTGTNTAWPNQLAEASATPGQFSDKTGGGVIAAGTSANNVYPVLIVSDTNRPSCFLSGDSRCAGTGDTADASGNLGELARSLGKYFAYLNTGCPSERLYEYLPNSSRRQALIPYFSHLVGNWSINDVAQGRTVDQLSGDIATLAGIAVGLGKKAVWATMCPSSTGTWTGAGGTGQTVSANNALRYGVNDRNRAGQIPNVSACFDIAGAMETGLNSGLWLADFNGAYTADGIHCNWAGYRRIENSGAVNPQLIARA